MSSSPRCHTGLRSSISRQVSLFRVVARWRLAPAGGRAITCPLRYGTSLAMVTASGFALAVRLCVYASKYSATRMGSQRKNPPEWGVGRCRDCAGLREQGSTSAGLWTENIRLMLVQRRNRPKIPGKNRPFHLRGYMSHLLKQVRWMQQRVSTRFRYQAANSFAAPPSPAHAPSNEFDV